jgi:3-hydroxyisobutyrate dehydrogenase
MRIAFIGLGNMGQAMAARLLDAGHELRLYNRTPARGDPLVARGAQRCASPRAAGAGVDAIVSMVADDAASRAVWLGEEGILSAATAGASRDAAAPCLAVECSTLSHGWVLELAGIARAAGLRYVDAPVTGLPDAARAGTLTLLVGAEADDLAAAQALLGSLSARVIHFGAVGAGTAYKLIINLVGAVQIASIAEGLAIAERAGLDLALVADAIAGSQAASPQVVRNTRRMVAADHDRDIVFCGALRRKDVDYGVQFAQACGIGSPFGTVAQRLYEALCARGEGALNESRIIDVARGQPPA